MKVWRVQDTNNNVGKAGAVSPGFKTDYPGEAEVITLGFAPGKSYDSVGIGRHGNFLQWGWSAAPSEMTEAGRKLFLNCISYIHRYDGKPFVRIPQISMTRDENLVRIFDLMEGSESRAKSYPPRFFPQEVLDEFKDDLGGMRKHYEANVEFVYEEDRKFCIDERIKSLGLSSNRKVGDLEKMIGSLSDPSQAEIAQELLLRYTNEEFVAPGEWRNWYKENSAGLFFSDCGGYKYYVMPKPETAPAQGQTDADRKIIEMAGEIEKRIADLRGQPFRKPVGKGILNKKQLKSYLLEMFEKDLPDEKIMGWEASLKVFGMIPGEIDLKETFIDFLTSQVGGFYDPEEKRLNCITTRLSYLQHIVMAHEILHALQDQYLDLEGYYKDVEFNDDLALARQCVIEGEAQYITNRYTQAYTAELAADMEDMGAADVGVLAMEQFAAMQNAPPYFTEIMMFPYLGGEFFIKAAIEEGGWSMVNALYKMPPMSSEQIIHPEKYFGDRDDPIKVVLPPMGPLLGEDYSKIFENSLGEDQVKLLIQLTADPVRALRASAGWDGDTYAVYRCGKTGRDLMVWAITFDSEKDSEEFFEAEARGLKNKYEIWGGGKLSMATPPEGMSVRYPEEVMEGLVQGFRAGDGSRAHLERRGKDVIVLDNFPPRGGTLLEEARKALWTFGKEAFDFKALRPK